METEIDLTPTIKLENRDTATESPVNGGWSFEGQREKILNGDVFIGVLWGEEHLRPEKILENRLRSWESPSQGINSRSEPESSIPLVVPVKYHPRNNLPLV